MAKKVYITTPIYYPSGKPHIGHVYSTLMADVLARYYQLFGYETYFLTGTDEFGQKIETAAQKENLEPLTYVTKMAEIFIELWKKMQIKPNIFMRTTLLSHQTTVQKIFQKLQAKNFIYLANWHGWYCFSCEENYSLNHATKNNNDEWICKFGHILVERNQPSYFLKISQFQNWLQEWFENSNKQILPESSKNEIYNNFIVPGLTDLSISRNNFSWGIKIPDDPEHVIYVWLDALCNYITALNYQQDNDVLFQKFWNDPETKIIHIIGKEIARFHAIYWPIILKGLELRNYDLLLAHGWILINQQKMSKSLNNSVDPFFLLKHFQLDGIRFYLLAQMPYYKDNHFSYEDLLFSYNHNLVNNYGNLISRISGLLQKYHYSKVPAYEECKFNDLAVTFDNLAKNLVSIIEKHLYEHDLAALIQCIMQMVFAANKLIEEAKPWILFKENKIQELNGILFLVYKASVLMVATLSPVLVDQSQQAMKQLNVDQRIFQLHNLWNDNSYFANKILWPPQILYERLDLNYLVKIGVMHEH